jgi:hypothetical protein
MAVHGLDSVNTHDAVNRIDDCSSCNALYLRQISAPAAHILASALPPQGFPYVDDEVAARVELSSPMPCFSLALSVPNPSTQPEWSVHLLRTETKFYRSPLLVEGFRRRPVR